MTAHDRASALRRSRRRAAEEYDGQRVLARRQPPFRVSERALRTANIAVRKAEIARGTRDRVVRLLEMSTSPTTPWWRTADTAEELARYLKAAERDFRVFVDGLEVPE